jgi:DNA end-binding protein Ku
MTSYSEWTKQVGDAWVAALKRAEDAIEAVSTGARESAAKVNLPPVQVPEQISRLNEAMADRLPKPAEIVEANFELTSRLLEAQRELTLRLIESASRQSGGESSPAASGAAMKTTATTTATTAATTTTAKKSPAKTAAKKSTAKKTTARKSAAKKTTPRKRSASAE